MCGMSREWLGEINSVVLVPFASFKNISEGRLKGLCACTKLFLIAETTD